MNYIAKGTEHAVVKTDPWTLIDLERGQQLTTRKEVDFYTDRADAIAAMRAHYPDFEPSEWKPTPPPQTVTMRQARLALLNADMLGQIDAAIAAIPDDKKRKAAEIEWEYAQVVERDSPLVRMFASQLGMSDEQIDDFFRAAFEIGKSTGETP